MLRKYSNSDDGHFRKQIVPIRQKWLHFQANHTIHHDISLITEYGGEKMKGKP